MKKTICIILIVAFAALFCTSAYFIFDHYRQEEQQAELYDSLADMVDSTLVMVAGTSIGFVQKINNSEKYKKAAVILKIVMGAAILLIGFYMFWLAF